MSSGGDYMARMIPDIEPELIDNSGERSFYRAARNLPDSYTVCYSYRYKEEEYRDNAELFREVDFVLVNPKLGFLVVEVKQGLITCRDGAWFEFKNNRYVQLSKDPVKQAQDGMFAILKEYTSRSHSKRFPLKIRYSFCFPECTRIEGLLPAGLDANGFFLFGDLENTLSMESKIQHLFEPFPEENKQAAEFLISKVLAPSFKVFNRVDDEIEQFQLSSQRTLTDEQERILAETELDLRKIFLGPAGSGKTFIAMEKSRRLAADGKKVLLTCFNKSLAAYLRTQLPEYIHIHNIHDLFLIAARKLDHSLQVPEGLEQRSDFFTNELPSLAFDYLFKLDDEDRFDAVIIDEGQDMKIEWFDCMEVALKEGGHFYVFADPVQSIFHQDIDELKKMPISRQQLTRNLRNTGHINEWISRFIPGRVPVCQARLGTPVTFIPFSTMDEERMLIEKEVGRLVSQGIPLNRIQILSPHIKDKSCLAGRQKLKEWPLVALDTSDHGIRFSTIRSYKGLEADIVFIIDLVPNSKVCTHADIYVGSSRARFQLTIFHDSSWNLPEGKKEN